MRDLRVIERLAKPDLCAGVAHRAARCFLVVPFLMAMGTFSSSNAQSSTVRNVIDICGADDVSFDTRFAELRDSRWIKVPEDQSDDAITMIGDAAFLVDYVPPSSIDAKRFTSQSKITEQNSSKNCRIW